MITTAAIIDYGMGNLYSVGRACEQVGIKPVLLQDERRIMSCDAMILPGVGAFGDAMQHLRDLQLIDPIKAFIKSGKPFLGVCLGMQLLMSHSEEFGPHEGLGILDGTVERFSGVDGQGRVVKVPQVGWNQISSLPGSWLSTLDREYMYFVHSYFVKPLDEKISAAQAVYGGLNYCCALRQDNVFAVQFHPEKSATAGLEVYKHWASVK